MGAVDGDVGRLISAAAMGDAMGQRAFPHQGKTGLRDIEAPRRTVCRHMDGILDGGRPGPRRPAVDAALAFCGCPGPSNVEFAFGNAQRLVNVSAKHPFAVTLGDPGARGLFSDFDCPLDCSMAEAAISRAALLAEGGGLEGREEARRPLQGRYVGGGQTRRSFLREPRSEIHSEGTGQHGPFQEPARLLAGREGPLPVERGCRMWG